jgi:hypothetical protein
MFVLCVRSWLLSESVEKAIVSSLVAVWGTVRLTLESRLQHLSASVVSGWLLVVNGGQQRGKARFGWVVIGSVRSVVW